MFVNIAQEQGWSFVFCSPENLPVERHVKKHIELYTGFPFGEKVPTPRLPLEKLVPALD